MSEPVQEHAGPVGTGDQADDAAVPTAGTAGHEPGESVDGGGSVGAGVSGESVGAWEADAPAEVGDDRLAGALRRLDELDELPPPAHVEIYEDVHRALQDRLAEASARGETPPGGGGGRGPHR